MTRVAFLQASLGIGGAERLVQSLVTRLDRGRIEPVVVNLHGPGAIGESLARAGVPCVSHLARSKWDPGIGRRLRALYAAERIDVVHLMDSSLPMFWAGRERRRSPRPPVVLGFHTTDLTNDPVQRFLASRSLLPVADRVVALASRHGEYLCRRYGIAPGRMEVIPSGVDLAAFSRVADRRILRAALELPLDAPIAGIVAALRPEKNHALFVEVAARVHARVPDARFLIVGEGPERPAIEDRVRAQGLQHVVRLLGLRQDVPRIWAALDVAVLTSRSETVPVSLMEANACGVPAVATDVGSVSEVVVNGTTGFLAPEGDAERIAARVGDLLADPDLRERMGNAAAERARSRFDMNVMVRAWEDLFERLSGRCARVK